MATFSDLFHRHIAASLDKQLAFNDLKQRWQDFSCDMQRGKLILSKNANATDLAFDIQILGSEGSDDTWQWIWHSPGAFPARLQEVAQAMRTLGQQDSIPEFTEPIVQIQRNSFLTGSAIAAVACCMHNAFAYVPLPYQNGNAFVLVQTQMNLSKYDNPITRMATVFPQLTTGNWAIPDFRRAFEGYCAYYSLEFLREDNNVVAHHPQYGSITAHFNDYNRLLNIEAKAVENKPSTGLASKFLKKG
jgi:hypothetical protein